MAPCKAFSTLIGLVAIRPSTANPTCLADQYQASDLVYTCGGSGGALEGNLIKARVGASTETVVATIPKGVSDFQASLRTSIDADMYIKDRSTGQSIYLVLDGGADSTGSSTRRGTYEGFAFEATQSVGLPTVESVRCTGQAPKDLQLVVRNNQQSEATVSVGYYYGPWSDASAACPWKTHPEGCLEYNQDAVEKSALAFSKWLSTAYQTCDQAWSQVGVPLTATGGAAVGVPYYNWANVFNLWPAQNRPNTNVAHLDRAMYKLATYGGLESNKQMVRRSDFLWICGLNEMDIQFTQPCCAKLRTAFTDEDDAWLKLGQIAGASGHQQPLQGMWLVCRSLPHAPISGRTDLFRFINSDPRHIATAPDIKFCWPQGPVQVHPTTQPLVVPSGQTINSPAPSTGGVQPWEDDGTGGASAPTPTPLPAATPAPAASGSTLYPTITDGPSTTPHGIDIAGHTTEMARGVTMEPEVIGASTSVGPHWQGIATAVSVGAAVAAGLVGGAAGIHHAIHHGGIQTGGSVSARREAEYTANQNQGAGASGSGLSGSLSGEGDLSGSLSDDMGLSGGGFTTLILLGVICSCFVLTSVVGGLLFCIRRKRRQNYEDEVYMRTGMYPADSDEDQENLLSHNGQFFPPPHPQTMFR